MIELISQPWPWYIAGAGIALVMFLLLWFGGEFGVSGALSTMCSACGAGKVAPFFNVNWRKQLWNVVFVFGALAGGFIAGNFLSNPNDLELSAATVRDLQALGISNFTGLAPADIFSPDQFLSLRSLIFIVLGGFLVGFGTRWAGGCTSGHAISGLSNLQLPSLIATIGFFIGGLIMTHLLLPILMNL
ncbi:MAG TPA: YeeE/YedE thiosulfate transporter family protein [Chitinophagales bacterium]|nr:YeeE/YedE thiosulfate transporter family protein [Chitinophagales bacterium]HRK28852.1 YeeE/YedE thiosulfate transporter family protein [Chitinophagales bacterium]